MSKLKVKQWKVRLFATLPASAEMTVEALTKEDAEQYAWDHHTRANWEGSNYSVPGLSDVDAVEAVEI